LPGGTAAMRERGSCAPVRRPESPVRSCGDCLADDLIQPADTRRVRAALPPHGRDARTPTGDSAARSPFADALPGRRRGCHETAVSVVCLTSAKIAEPGSCFSSDDRVSGERPRGNLRATVCGGDGESEPEIPDRETK